MAASLAWSAVLSTQRTSPEHVEPLSLYQVESHLVLDATAQRNLELFRSIAGGGRKGSLLNAVDMTSSPMGGRLLKQWLGLPLRSQTAIEARHQAVEELVGDPLRLDALREALGELPDLPRLVGRASLGQATPRDLAALRDALLALPGLRSLLEPMQSALVAARLGRMSGLGPLAQRLYDSLAPSPPASLAEGGVIAKGVSPELDELRQLRGAGKDWIAALQAELRAATGIPSLKVSFNKVFGYYIEVTKAHLEKVPESFIRKQTLVNSERYITPELKDKEAAVLGAEEKALELERQLFEGLRAEVAAEGARLVAASRAVAEVDVIAGLARLALSRDYVRPVMSPGGPLSISAGRHPVVEQMLPEGEFVPNDVFLDDREQQVLIITGPNMAGKSTILRQVALICLLAQAGSFVPASQASLPLIDRVFTRVGGHGRSGRGALHLHGGDDRDQPDPGRGHPALFGGAGRGGAGAPPPLTACPWPGPWPNICTTWTEWGSRPCSPPTTTSSPSWPPPIPGPRTSTWRSRSTRAPSCFCGGWPRAG